MAAIMLQTIHSFYAKISEKSLLISAVTYEKYINCKDYCIGHQDDKTCFLPICIHHIVLLGEVEELLHKLDTFCLPINTWTTFIPCSSNDSAEKLMQRVEMCLKTCKEPSLLTKGTEQWTKCRVLQKRGS